MQRSVFMWVGALFILAACEGEFGGTAAPSGGFIAELPEGVLALAAPYQDLTAVRIDPADGCYVYRHFGPVETTFLPLRSRTGAPICTRLPANASTTATG